MCYTITWIAYQEIGDGQVHEHRVYPSAGLAPAFQDDREHRDVADGRDDHQYAVSDYGDHVSLVEPHIVRQIRLVEHGRVRHVVHARPPSQTIVHADGHRVQHRVRVGFHHFHDCGGGGGWFDVPTCWFFGRLPQTGSAHYRLLKNTISISVKMIPSRRVRNNIALLFL